MEHCEGYMSPSLVQEGYMRVGPIKTGPGPMPPAPKMPRPQAAEQTPLSREIECFGSALAEARVPRARAQPGQQRSSSPPTCLVEGSAGATCDGVARWDV